ncbi:PREDICTED: centrosomal protein CEP57L1 isoform X3 [Sturnus vulgaris]|nr:PREDICTED: centrosomal protein CEP57L1 isoform X3 [Sturnus vulgaris]XP_014748904.1 PREDICTED: centrosomal protein CEP57L1 isoform X3 [Sturnus vulgaris]XP_014748905.1 PREDICTED: centrosomal protein CEP57L1 isoform X3 [Sturnus vulgaris]XP_014748906.1 PREDICTED: centrosomal protein CEP57L1 isoform X3 [Sturnus vulgaris]XP_014748907.1 PREDICTED: centrosomal protein CEP57L1 isoform X3 [Sturnus vulgaris]
MDSESKNSFIGSFLQPPDWMLPAAFVYKESKKLAAAAGDRPSLPNKQAVVAALKALQEKIHRLELEKSQAEDKLCSLSRAAAQYKKVLEDESYEKNTAHQQLMQRKDASVQLNAAQSRCSLLEKQLDYMRKMVSSAELEKKIILEQQAQLQKEEGQNRLELHAKLEKLEMLEKECLKLTATQRIAEDKIKHLEEKLCKEEHQHKLIQDKTAQFQTSFDVNRILMSSVTSQYEPEKENGKNKKPRKRNPTMKKMQLSRLHVKAGELPFVAGKSASSSHSVSANVQSVLHIMKHRNPCISLQRQGGATAGISGHSVLSKSVSSCSTTPTATRSFSDLLLALQDELGQMSSEHQELLKQIQETQDSQAREDLEQELDWLVKQMEMKGKQISKLKKHQATVQKLKRKTQKLKQGATHVKLKCGEQKEARGNGVTVKESMSKPCPGQKSRSSLQLLKAVRKLQLSLKKDDVI